MNKKIVAIILFIVCMFIFDYIDDVLDDNNEKFTIEEIQKNSELYFKKKKKQNIGTCIKGEGVCYHKNNIYHSSPIIPCTTAEIYNNTNKVPTIIDTNTFDGNMFYRIHTPFLVNGRNSDKPRSCI